MELVCTRTHALTRGHRFSAPQLDPENEVLKSVVAAVLQPVPKSFAAKATPEASNPKVDWVLE
jgi:hypothetical protein